MPELRQQRALNPYIDLSSGSSALWELSRTTSNKSCSFSDYYNENPTGGCRYCESYNFTDTTTNKRVSKQCGCNEGLSYDYMESLYDTKLRVRDEVLVGNDGYSEIFPIANSDYSGMDFEDIVKYQSFCSQQRLAYLRTNYWLDQSTRILTASFCVVPFTAFTLVEGNVALSTDVSACFRAIFHVDRYRYVTPTYEIFVGQVFPAESAEAIQVGFRIAFVVLPIYFIICELLEVLVLLKQYFRSETKLWNILDVFIHLLSLNVGFGFQPDPFDLVDTKKDGAMENTFNELEKNTNYTKVAGFVLFLSTIRLLKHFGGISDSSRLPILTIFRALYDSQSFFVFLFFWVLACGFLTTFVLGTMFSSFRSPTYSMVAIARSTLGDVDFDQFSGTTMEIAGPMLLSLLTVFTLYFVFTMFVSIIDNAYQCTKEDLEKEAEKKVFETQRIKKRKKYVGDYLYMAVLKRFPIIISVYKVAAFEIRELESGIKKLDKRLDKEEEFVDSNPRETSDYIASNATTA